MGAIFVFGLGYTGSRLATRLRDEGWIVSGTGGAGLAFDDPAVRPAVAAATHIVSTVPPGSGSDPVLDRYGDALAGKWLGYVSSTGVYGDSGGAWVDESAPLDGRRPDRIAADRAWQAIGASIFRLPGIYGPGRSPLDRVAAGAAHRIDLPGHVFSRIHVDDVVEGIIAGFAGPAGAYNLADDRPTSQNAVVEMACGLLGLAPPPLLSLEKAALSSAARAFYSECRRISNGKAGRLLGWTPRYADFTTGLRALSAKASPAMTSTPPATASAVQR